MLYMIEIPEGKSIHSERCEILAEYMIEHHSTVRRTAAVYGISKSTVHKDLTEKLPRLNPKLFGEVHQILECNKAERHLRGGEATRIKYLRRADIANHQEHDQPEDPD